MTIFQLVAPAVEAFYDRDVDSMKAAAKMAFALPEGLETPLVKASVQFSRAMYAQVWDLHDVERTVFASFRRKNLPPRA